MTDSRKVQFLSGTTFSVSLPKKWASGVGLKTGDEVMFEPQPDGKLLLSAHSVNGQRLVERRTIFARGLDMEQLERRVTALYLEGVEAIEIVSERDLDASRLAALENLPHHLTGLEILENGPRRVVLQDMLNPTEVDVEKAFLRVYGIASSMHRNVLAALSEHDASKISGLSNDHNDLDRMSRIATRQVRLRIRRPDSTPDAAASDLIGLASGLLLVQRMGDNAMRLAEATIALLEPRGKDGVIAQLVEVCSRALLICDVAARAFHKGDVRAADAALAQIPPFERRLRELRERGIAACIEDKAGSPCLSIVQALEWLQASVGVGATLAQLAVQRAASRPF